MWPWSAQATALKEQLDRIERNQLRIAAALKITTDLEHPPVGVPERIAPRAPRRKLTEADVHFVGRPVTHSPPIAVPATADQSRPLVSPIDVLTDLDAPVLAPMPAPMRPPASISPPAASGLPLGSNASERPARPPAPPAAQAMHWRDSGSLPTDLP